LTHEDVAPYFASGAFPVGHKVAVLDIRGHAGQAYRLYDIFDREPDIKGLSNHVERLDEGARLTDVAHRFLVSEEFTLNFGALNTLSNRAYVNVLYENVLDRPGEARGVNYWTAQLDQGVSRETVFVAFSESHENQAQVAPLLANGILLSESVLV
jgi:hypothetical protein